MSLRAVTLAQLVVCVFACRQINPGCCVFACRHINPGCCVFACRHINPGCCVFACRHISPGCCLFACRHISSGCCMCLCVPSHKPRLLYISLHAVTLAQLVVCVLCAVTLAQLVVCVFACRHISPACCMCLCVPSHSDSDLFIRQYNKQKYTLFNTGLFVGRPLLCVALILAQLVVCVSACRHISPGCCVFACRHISPACCMCLCVPSHSDSDSDSDLFIRHYNKQKYNLFTT